MTAEPIEVGAGIRLTETACAHGRYGYLFEHYRPDLAPEFDGMCAHEVPTCSQHEHPFWTVEIDDPLTLSPSLLLVDEGLHGFIREGKWVPA